MSILDVILLASLVVGALIGTILLLVKMNILALSRPKKISVFYNILTIIALLLAIMFTVKILSSDAGKKWLYSFSENGDCDRVDKPYWCDL